MRTFWWFSKRVTGTAATVLLLMALPVRGPHYVAYAPSSFARSHRFQHVRLDLLCLLDIVVR